MTPDEALDAGLLDCDTLLTALQSPALIVDRHRRIRRANAAAYGLCRAAGAALVEGQPVAGLFPAADEHWPAAIESFEFCAALAGADGASRLQLRGAPLCSREGAPAGWLVLLGRQEAEAAGAPHLRTLLASLDDLVFVFDARGCVLEYHQGPGDGRTIPPEEWVGRTYQEFLPAPFADRLTAVMHTARATGEVQRFDHPLGLDGEEHWFSTNVGLVRGDDNRPSGFVAVARNITQSKRIEAAEQEQRALAEALQDVALALNSTLHLEEIWERILANVVRVVPADWAAILLIEDGVAHLVGERGYTAQGLGALLARFEMQVKRFGHLQYMVDSGQPYLVADTWDRRSWSHEDVATYGEWPFNQMREMARSYLGAPIVLDGQVIGFINLTSNVANHFTPLDIERLQAFSIHAASAIRNAQVYAQARELAAVHERQRLARELHDAVSQMLFSAKIIAEMLPRLRERDPERVWRYLPELHRLIQGAMGEMRTLLLELRPGSLTDADLDVLLGYLVDAAGGRTSARIGFTCEGECRLQSEVQVALYRIAQEALTNAVKHAHAANISLTIRVQAGGVELAVEDDGCGFEPEAVRAQNLGLRIMRERADEIGASLALSSVVQQGTSIRVLWPAPQGGP